MFLLISLVFHLANNQSIVYNTSKRDGGFEEMPRYKVKLTDSERASLNEIIQKGGKGYRIRHAQILLKLEAIPENADWTYERIKDAYGAVHSTIAGVAKRFVFEGLEAALGRKKQENYHRKVTGEIEARICAIACSEPPEGRSRWTMQMIYSWTNKYTN